MCGIALVFGPLGGQSLGGAREALVEEMCQLMRHRGPDDGGVYSDPALPLSLGHRRLSIIDLSPEGHQPMRRGGLVVSYNGEVYNYLELREELAGLGHRFHTSSDTEVLLAAFAQWGDEAPHHLNGMFTILLWDEGRRRLLLCRDRFGVKPLYYLLDPSRGVLLAASEPKAVLHAARRLSLKVGVDRDVLCCYLMDANTEDGERTFFDRVRRVMPGELIACEPGADPGRDPLHLVRRRWYELTPERCPAPGDGPGPGRAGHDQGAQDERFLHLLTDAVRLRLRSDVRVGTCLSGGLDSSALVCLSALRLGVRPHSFSAVYGRDDPADESRFIDAVMAHAGVDNQRIDPQGRFSPEALLSFVALHDEPIGGTTVWAQHCVFRLAREHGMIVMLDGQGADETLTGYHGAFRPLFAELLLGQGHDPLRLGLLHELAAARELHGYRPLRSLLGAGWLLFSERVMPPGLFQRYLDRKWRGYFTAEPSALPALGPRWERDKVRRLLRAFRAHVPERPPEAPHVGAWKRRSLLHGYLYQLITGPSLQTILRYEDRNSMAASIEARAPFLDYRLVQHCLAQPPGALLRDGYTKALLRRTLSGILPESVRLRPDKIGFATPEGRWLRGPLREVLLDLLSSQSMAQRGWFHVPALQKDFARFCATGADLGGGAASEDSSIFWKALNVELWLRQHGLTG